MSKALTLVRNITPPILLKTIKSFLKKPIWSGNYKTWNDASMLCQGYVSPLVLERVSESLRSVLRGEASFERDSVLFKKENFSDTMLAPLLYCSIKCRNSLNVYDFGGSLGSSYYQLKNILTALNLNYLSWKIIEQPHFVTAGKSEFEDTHLKFFNSIEDAQAEDTSTTKKVLVMSASLQYLEHPLALLREILTTNTFDYVVMARIPFQNSPTNRLTIQNVPSNIYPVKYPCWFFNETEFLRVFSGQYELIMNFSAPDFCADFPSVFKGFLFERRQAK